MQGQCCDSRVVTSAVNAAQTMPSYVPDFGMFTVKVLYLIGTACHRDVSPMSSGDGTCEAKAKTDTGLGAALVAPVL